MRKRLSVVSSRVVNSGVFLLWLFFIVCPVLGDSVTLTPDDLSGPSVTAKYAYDWDEAPPIGSFDKGGAPGFGDSSWFSDVDGSAAGTGRDYTAFRLFVNNIFSSPITVGQLDNISYWSNWVSGSVDWQVKIYTAKSTGSNWYGQRANLNRGTVPSTGWNQWNAVALGVEWLNNRNGASPINSFGISWDGFKAAAGSEQILFIDICASYMTSSPPSYTYLDGVNITLTDGRSITADLEAVPEPTTMVLLGLGLVGLVGGRRKFLG